MICVMRTVRCGFTGYLTKIRRQQPHQITGRQDTHQGNTPDQNGQGYQDIVRQSPGLLFSQTLIIIGENRNKGSTQGPFGKKIAQEIGYAEGHDKGIHSHAGTEKIGQNLLPDKSQDSTAKDGKTHGSGRSGNGSGLA